jgi:peptidoglycan/LPS O-acetylase OafA/YrhL
MSYWPNFFGFLATFFLTYFVFSMAFNSKFKVTKLLNGNDFSYGLYIYHGIVLNLFIELNVKNSIGYFILYLIIVILLSILSWKFIEKQFIKLKTNPMLIK